MITEFTTLTDDERETMMKIPALVFILIAGADDNIDRKEIRKAVGIAYTKQKHAREALVNYYKEVGQDFEDKIMVLVQQYSPKVSDRNPLIIEELEKLNSILPKLDPQFAVEFYASLRKLAKKVAKASGGVLGYMAVGHEESKLMNLKMIKDPAV
jgi:hypothetical protein